MEWEDLFSGPLLCGLDAEHVLGGPALDTCCPCDDERFSMAASEELSLAASLSATESNGTGLHISDEELSHASQGMIVDEGSASGSEPLHGVTNHRAFEVFQNMPRALVPSMPAE